MIKSTTRYAVKRDGKYMARYAEKRAEWTQTIDGAWTTRDAEWAKNISGLCKGSRVVELTILERTLKPFEL